MSLIANMRRKAGTGLLVGGHRGHCPGFRPESGLYPGGAGADAPSAAQLAACDVRENTIQNFERVKDIGLSHIEVDVQLTADGEVVVYHDMDLAARSPLAGPVRVHKLQQLRDAFTINTLDEVLAWCASADMPAAIELKCVPMDMADTMPLLVERVADAIRAHRFFEMSFVLSIDHKSLYDLKRISPHVNLAPIVPHVPHDPVALMRQLEALIYLSYLENLSPNIIRAVQGAGCFVDGSVVNGAYRLQKALALGVDMIESDCPAVVMELYRR